MYSDLLKTRKARREALFDSHRFLCMCKVCTLPQGSSQARISDENRQFLGSLLGKMNESAGYRCDTELLEKALRAAEEENLPSSKAMILYYGGPILMPEGKAKALLGLEWAKEALKLYTILEGEDSYNVKDLKAVLGPFARLK